MVACGDDGSTNAPDPSMMGDAGGRDAVPTDTDALLTWLEDDDYGAWASEDQSHPSNNHMWPEDGPEGRPDVRTYMNETLTRSIESGASSHPVGSAAVKEHFVTGGNDVMMWTVMVKVEEDSGDGEGWFWAMGNPMGMMVPDDPISRCADCHSQGDDFVTTSYPFEH